MTSHPPSTQLSIELGHFLIDYWRAVVLRIRSSKSRTSRQNHVLKFGMVGTHKSLFRNVKRKGKVIFDHSTTLNMSYLLCAWRRTKYTIYILNQQLPIKLYLDLPSIVSGDSVVFLDPHETHFGRGETGQRFSLEDELLEIHEDQFKPYELSLIHIWRCRRS